MTRTYGSSSCKDLKYNYASRIINYCCVVLIYFRRNTSGIDELHNYFNPYYCSCNHQTKLQDFYTGVGFKTGPSSQLTFYCLHHVKSHFVENSTIVTLIIFLFAAGIVFVTMICY